MKLLLCSEGFASQNTIDECSKLCQKPLEDISIAIINEAYAVEDGDKRWVIDNLNAVVNNFPSDIDIVNLLALSINEIEERIASKDVIFAVGGHTDYLMSVYKKTGFDTLLTKLLRSKVYVGSSAGSMVIGKRISSAAYSQIYDEEGQFGIDSYLEFVDFSIMPHLDSPHFPHRRETLLKAIDTFEGLTYGLRDDSAVVVNEQDVYTVGSTPLIIENGKLK